ncbi:hypothetical protein BBP40_001275 [Aspergillus hancockii]|nr:hypothetical protein BBP40_001275 [Aspergillus hancockii]
MARLPGRSPQHTRPRTDYERWLEDQGIKQQPADNVQYHPPALKDDDQNQVSSPVEQDWASRDFEESQSDIIQRVSGGSHGHFLIVPNTATGNDLQRNPPKLWSDNRVPACTLVVLIMILALLKVAKASRNKHRHRMTGQIPQETDHGITIDEKKHMI